MTDWFERDLSEQQIRSKLSQLKRKRSFAATFMLELLRSGGAASLVDRWREAVSLHFLAGGDWVDGYWPQARAIARTKLEALRAPPVIAAIQAATTMGRPGRRALAALIADGSETSMDALVTEFERVRAARDLDALKRLARFERYASKATWAVIGAARTEAIAALRAERRPSSMAAVLGLSVRGLEFSGSVASSRGHRAYIDLSDEKMRTFANSGSNGVYTSDAHNKLADVRDLPGWLARQSTKCGLWAWGDAHFRTNLRGASREAFFRWLRGEAETPLRSE